MTDEKMAEEFADNIDGLDFTCSLLSAKDKSHAYRLGRYDGFLAGLKTGRLTKWHKVADGDLPEEGVEVLNDDGVAVILLKGHWRYVYGGEWEDDACLDHWCEIPKFEE